MDKAKQQIVETVDAAREDLLALSKNIHDNPELGFQEFKAMALSAIPWKSMALRCREATAAWKRPSAQIFAEAVRGRRWRSWRSMMP